MPDRHFHQSGPVFSATNIRRALGSALDEIKREDDLTDEDLGKVLGKSADRARAYRLCEATMDAETFARGKREWNGRFTGYFDRLCVESRPGHANAREAVATVLRAAVSLSEAKLSGADFQRAHILRNRSAIEQARDVLDDLLRATGGQ